MYLPNDFVQHMVHIPFGFVHARLGTRLWLSICGGWSRSSFLRGTASLRFLLGWLLLLCLLCLDPAFTTQQVLQGFAKNAVSGT